VSDRGRFLEALASLSQASGPRGDLCSPFVVALPVAGAAVSTLGDPLGSGTVCSTDERAARLDEIQIDLGEGPCWDALTTRAPVLAAEVQTVASDRWPIAAAALRETGLEAVFAFPLVYGRLGLGAVDLYADAPGTLTADDVVGATTLAGVAARHVLHRAVASLGLEAPDDVDRYSRREVHQASGMVSAQLSIDVDDALLVLRGHAFATGTSLREVAADVVARRVDFGE
jgi:hypothetical protein